MSKATHVDWGMIIFPDKSEKSNYPKKYGISDPAITKWVNLNPPDFKEPQSRCAACGKIIELQKPYGWAFLGDGALVCYGNSTGTRCQERWTRRRRDEALAALNKLCV